MYVVSFIDGTTHVCAEYSTSDNGIEFADRDGDVFAFAPYESVRYVRDAQAGRPFAQPDREEDHPLWGEEDGNDSNNDNNNNNNNNNNN